MANSVYPDFFQMQSELSLHYLPWTVRPDLPIRKLRLIMVYTDMNFIFETLTQQNMGRFSKNLVDGLVAICGINVKKIAFGSKEHTTDQKMGVSVLQHCVRPLAYT